MCWRMVLCAIIVVKMECLVWFYKCNILIPNRAYLRRIFIFSMFITISRVKVSRIFVMHKICFVIIILQMVFLSLISHKILYTYFIREDSQLYSGKSDMITFRDCKYFHTPPNFWTTNDKELKFDSITAIQNFFETEKKIGKLC